MKRLVTLMVAGVMAFLLTACGGEAPKPEVKEQPAPAQQTPEAAPKPEAAAEKPSAAAEQSADNNAAIADATPQE